MKSLSISMILGFGVFVVCYSQGATVVGPDPRANLEQGVEVQARGPVHEAFAQPSMRRQGAAPVLAKKPPEPVNELPAEQKPEEASAQWIPGYWAFDDDRNDFLWVSGIWRIPPPGRHWVPGYWQQQQEGWQWVSGYWGVQAQSEEQIFPPPPEPIAEALPPAPDDNSGYVPGCWIYQQDRYFWRPGFWAPFRPGWLWTSASYIWTPAGFVFVDGFWDHDFHLRGVLFAPASLDPRFYGRPDWVYRPRFAILADFLLQALFVRPAVNHYFFGDYYDPRYAGLGYRDWIDFRLGDRYYNSVSYYRWQNRSNPRWETDLRVSYKARHAGTLARPPRTLAAQVKGGAGTGKTLALLTPINQFKSPAIKLQALSKVQVQEIHKVSQQVQVLRQHRAKMEMQSAPKVANANNAVKFELHQPPKTTVKPAPGSRTPPPVPVHPKVSPKVQPKHPAGPRGKSGKSKDPHHQVQSDPDYRPVLSADSHYYLMRSAPGPNPGVSINFKTSLKGRRGTSSLPSG